MLDTKMGDLMAYGLFCLMEQSLANLNRIFSVKCDSTDVTNSTGLIASSTSPHSNPGFRTGFKSCRCMQSISLLVATTVSDCSLRGSLRSSRSICSIILYLSSGKERRIDLRSFGVLLSARIRATTPRIFGSLACCAPCLPLASYCLLLDRPRFFSGCTDILCYPAATLSY